MGRLVFSMSVSLDGFVDSPEHTLDWVLVDEELHRVFNDEAREARTGLYGRRMWELMGGYWPYVHDDPDATPAMHEFGDIWAASTKIVFSRTLETVEHGARLVGGDAVEEVRRLKVSTDHDLSTGGPTFTTALIEAGLVDEFRLYVHPVVLGGGTRFFEAGIARFDLRLLDTRAFDSGVTLLRYERA
jgi:dihydrofolate reductase